MKYSPAKIYTVSWRDHTSDPSWKSDKELKKWGDTCYNALCTSIGHIVFDAKNYIIVAGEKDGDGNHGNCTMILKSAITKITLKK